MQMVSLLFAQMQPCYDIILEIQHKYRLGPVWCHFWTLSDI